MSETGSPVRPEVRRTLGRLPEFWDRSVLFVANLLSLFFGNDAGTRCLEEAVNGIESYGGRLVPILDLLFRGSGGHNALILRRSPDAALLDYFRSIGLSIPHLAATDRTLEEIRSDLERGTLPPELRVACTGDAQWLEGFVTDDALVSFANAIGKQPVNSPAASRAGNNKLLLHRHLETSGLPVFTTHLAHDAAEARAGLLALERAGFRKAVLKSQVGASGIGLIKVETRVAHEPLASDLAPDFLFFEGPCMVQGWIDEHLPGVSLIGSPSVQIFLDDAHVHLFDLTEQMLSSGSVHEGNCSPPPYCASQPWIEEELLRQAEIAGEWLWDQGYRGTASVDFLTVLEAGRGVAYACEINARVTGATYPSVLARRLAPGASWAMRNLRSTEPLPAARVVDSLEEEEVLFRAGAPHGIVPINFNVDTDGLVQKGQFLVLASAMDECFHALERTRRLLSLDYDRD